MAATSEPIPLPILQLDGILMGKNEFLAALGILPAPMQARRLRTQGLPEQIA